MTKGIVAGIAAGALVVAAAAAGLAQSDQVEGFEVPRFEVDPEWPKLPNGWKLGITSSVTVDQHDHVWILHRPRILHNPSDAPPVLEIDEDGNFVQGWGGLSDEYDWPHSEHGIALDANDNVWITGHNPYPGTGEDSSDDMLLKFTRTGEFLLQIGGRDTSRGNTDTESLHTATDLDVHDGEVYISDGYGNRRVIVFDADTGEYRRMWGAFPVGGSGSAPAPTVLGACAAALHSVDVLRRKLLAVGAGEGAAEVRHLRLATPVELQVKAGRADAVQLGGLDLHAVSPWRPVRAVAAEVVPVEPVARPRAILRCHRCPVDRPCPMTLPEGSAAVRCRPPLPDGRGTAPARVGGAGAAGTRIPVLPRAACASPCSTGSPAPSPRVRASTAAPRLTPRAELDDHPLLRMKGGA